MNSKERRSYENLKDAKSKIKKAKVHHEESIKYINNLVTFIEENIKVNSTKNIRSDVKQYTDKMNKNNTNLDTLIKRLDKNQEKIKEISNLRKEAEKFGN